MAAVLAHRLDSGLTPDPARVIARLYLPGEAPPRGRSRTAGVVARVLALDETEVEHLAESLLMEFGPRHRNYRDLLTAHAAVVSPPVDDDDPAALSAARRLLIGAIFTAEYAVEAAALCNPSAVLHPDQSGLEPGQARVAVSLRAIGEGHISTVGFATAVVGPGPEWTFQPRARPSVTGTNSPARWRREQLAAVLADQEPVDVLTVGVLASLPDEFTDLDLESGLAAAPADLLARPGAQSTLELLRRLVTSAYEVTFPEQVELSQRVLFPATDEESNGMEDLRVVRFTGPDGAVAYRATYTAYDGRHIAPRMLTSPDLRTFHAHRLAGPAASNKGMALFPRLVGGRYLALCRSDGESTCLASSPDGLVWGEPERIQVPEASWELLQIGNCGPPIETPAGWLVLTHGVGPMRTYSIGAILLDLENPTRVLGRLERPLLTPSPQEQDGYVPNVLYSCGGVVHEGRLWLPYGIGDSRIGIAWVSVAELLAALAPATLVNTSA